MLKGSDINYIKLFIIINLIHYCWFNVIYKFWRCEKRQKKKWKERKKRKERKKGEKREKGEKRSQRKEGKLQKEIIF